MFQHPSLCPFVLPFKSHREHGGSILSATTTGFSWVVIISNFLNIHFSHSTEIFCSLVSVLEDARTIPLHVRLVLLHSENMDGSY